MSRVILVTGATGKQGGAVIDNLVAANVDLTILAATRNTASPSAHRLVKKSPKIKLIQGDLNDPAAIFKAAKAATSNPIWGVYSVQIPMGSGQTVETEVTQGKALIDESLNNKVQHFVYSSVDRGGKLSSITPTPVPHFASKHAIEQHLISRTSNGEMAWTILRPVGFMDNYTPSFQTKIFTTAWKAHLGDQPQQLVACRDIGFFAAQAFLHSGEYNGKAISLAGDEMTFAQIDELFRRKTGKGVPTTFGCVASLMLMLVKELGAMFRWMKEGGFDADVEECRRMNPGMMGFERYLEEQSGFYKKG